MTEQPQGGSGATDVANRWIEAYNTKDLDTIRSLCADDIRLEHHNRGVLVEGPDAVIALMEQFGGLAPDRRFHSVRRQFSDGERVVTELTWEATPTVDVPDFAAKGETLTWELACVWTVRDGQIVQYDDYG
jgi:steroid delta-isomerase-like uncharacterized protein